MSSTTESLLFKINVTSTGLNSAAIDALTKSLQGLANVRLTGNLGNIFNGVDTGAKTAKSSIDGFTSSMQKGAAGFKNFDSAGKPVVGTIKTIDAELKKLQADQARMGAGMDALAGKVGGFTANLNANKAAAAAYAAEMRKGTVANEQLGATAAATSGQLGREAAAFKQVTASANENATAGRKVVTTNEQIANSQNQVNSAMSLSRGAMKANAQEMTNYISRAAGMFISVVGLSQAMQESVGMHRCSSRCS